MLLEGTKWKGVECRAHRFGRDLFEGMAVAQQADVFISLHGSGEMNASEWLCLHGADWQGA